MHFQFFYLTFTIYKNLATAYPMVPSPSPSEFHFAKTNMFTAMHNSVKLCFNQ